VTPKPRLDTARVFERVSSIYRAQAGVLLPSAIIVYLIPAAIGATNRIYLQFAASFICGVYYQGMVVQAVRDIQDGVRDLALGRLFRSVGPVLAQLMWTAILIGLGVGLGFLAFIIPGLVLATMWSVAVPVVVCEVRTAPQALGRSRELVRGHGWQVFAVLVVTVLIVLVADAIFATVATAISNNDVVFAVGNLIATAITAPILVLAAAVVYLELLQLKGEPLPPADMAGLSRRR
jgi:hypothetical protein